jgi:hypothetical protein
MPGETFPMNDEIRPPEWAVGNATRLTMKGFGEAFARNWRSSTDGMFKVEAWQTYQEPDTKSLRAFENGRFQEVRSLVEAEAGLADFFYEDIQGKDLSSVRARIVKLPLSPYLEWEFWNYRIRIRLGELVRVVDYTGAPESLPNQSYFDFLLFDRTRALVHDYGTDGLQIGGWEVASGEAIDHLSSIADELRIQSIDLESFISSHKIKLPGDGQII